MSVYFDRIIELILLQNEVFSLPRATEGSGLPSSLSPLSSPFSPLSSDFKDAPPTRRRVTPLTHPARSPLGGSDQSSASHLSGLAGQHTTLLTGSVSSPDGPGHFPDIRMADNGTIVLCPGCSGSDASKDGDYFICRSCGSVWRNK